MVNEVMVRKQSSNAISKVCAVLKVLTGQGNLRLADVADAAGLNRVTALRILEDLSEQNFVARRGKPPRYSLGPEAVAMAAAPSLEKDVRDAAQASMLRLTEFSKDTVLLSIRSGSEAICIDKSMGSFPIQANFLQIGDRRPLGVGAGSMALLAYLPEAEREANLEATLGRISNYPRIDRPVLEEHIADARTKGYVRMLDIVIDRIGAIGVPIFLSDGTLAASISIAALTERIVERERELSQVALVEAKRVANQLSKHSR